MRIKMSGQYRPHEFQDAVDCIVQALVANGMNEIRSANLYINAFHNDRQLEFADQETGAPFKLLKFEGRDQRQFKTFSPRVQPIADDGDTQ